MMINLSQETSRLTPHWRGQQSGTASALTPSLCLCLPMNIRCLAIHLIVFSKSIDCSQRRGKTECVFILCANIHYVFYGRLPQEYLNRPLLGWCSLFISSQPRGFLCFSAFLSLFLLWLKEQQAVTALTDHSPQPECQRSRLGFVTSHRGAVGAVPPVSIELQPWSDEQHIVNQHPPPPPPPHLLTLCYTVVCCLYPEEAKIELELEIGTFDRLILGLMCVWICRSIEVKMLLEAIIWRWDILNSSHYECTDKWSVPCYYIQFAKFLGLNLLHSSNTELHSW